MAAKKYIYVNNFKCIVDGITWTNSATGGDQLNAIAYAKGIFVAVGANGRRIRSNDKGVTWTDDKSKAGFSMYSIAYMK